MQFNRDCNDTHALLDLRKWRVPIRVHFQINWGSGRLLEYNRRWLSLITTIRSTRFHSRMMMTLTEPHIVCWSWACLYSPLPFNPFIIIFIHSSNWSNLCDWHVDGTTHGSENTVITQSVKTPNANNSNRVSSTRYLAQASNLSPVHSPHLLLLLSRPKTSRLLFCVLQPPPPSQWFTSGGRFSYPTSSFWPPLSTESSNDSWVDFSDFDHTFIYSYLYLFTLGLQTTCMTFWITVGRKNQKL